MDTKIKSKEETTVILPDERSAALRARTEAQQSEPPAGAAPAAVTSSSSAEVDQPSEQPQPVVHFPSQADIRAEQFDFVTFDSERKYLARIISINGKKVTIRRFDKKTGEWKSKNEKIELKACIPLTPAEAEMHFPGSVAAWDNAAQSAAASGGDPSARTKMNEENDYEEDRLKQGSGGNLHPPTPGDWIDEIAKALGRRPLPFGPKGKCRSLLILRTPRHEGCGEGRLVWRNSSGSGVQADPLAEVPQLVEVILRETGDRGQRGFVPRTPIQLMFQPPLLHPCKPEVLVANLEAPAVPPIAETYFVKTISLLE
jgi:hypothetical protein